MASARYMDLLKQGFMKPLKKPRGPKKVKPTKLLFVLHYNRHGNWADSAVCAFHASSTEEAKQKADGWARRHAPATRHHAFSKDVVGVEEITLDALGSHKVEIHDEWLP